MTTPDIPQSPEPKHEIAHVCCAGGDPECEGCLLCDLARDDAGEAAPSHPCVYRQEVA